MGCAEPVVLSLQQSCILTLNKHSLGTYDLLEDNNKVGVVVAPYFDPSK